MITGPQLEDKPAQPYVAIRRQVTMQDFSSVIDQTFPEVFGWLEKPGLAPAGPPLIRYLVINMADKLEVELGVPVATAVSVDDGVSAGVLPSGRYASLVYTGHFSGLTSANKVLLDWGAEQGLVWDASTVANGDAFCARFESYRTDPRAEPDPSKWQTEVAIRVLDNHRKEQP
jgi:effector-binding domain-containing protein